MNAEYVLDRLDPSVDAKVQVSLARAAEEASELTKEAMKGLRFGLQNRFPAEGPTNAEKIIAEFEDIARALADAGLLVPTPTGGLVPFTRAKA